MVYNISYFNNTMMSTGFILDYLLEHITRNEMASSIGRDLYFIVGLGGGVDGSDMWTYFSLIVI